MDAFLAESVFGGRTKLAQEGPSLQGRLPGPGSGLRAGDPIPTGPSAGSDSTLSKPHPLSFIWKTGKQDLIRHLPKVAFLSKEMIKFKILHKDKKRSEMWLVCLIESLHLGGERPIDAPASTWEKSSRMKQQWRESDERS